MILKTQIARNELTQVIQILKAGFISTGYEIISITVDDSDEYVTVTFTYE